MAAIAVIDPVASIRSAHQVTGTRFSVDPSPLRSQNATSGIAQSDPVRDSVELTRYYPQLLVGVTYEPPPVQKFMGLADESAPYPGLGGGDTGTDEPLAGTGETGTEGEGEGEGEPAGPEEAAVSRGESMSQEEQLQIAELKSRDMEVRAHEQAHKAVGGSYAGGISYEYQQGPDGKRYAVGGEVSIDVSSERDPSATIAKMRQVKAAAMAPANPSAQDRSVAAQASQNETQARRELREEQLAESQSAREEDAGAASEKSGAEKENSDSGGNAASLSGRGNRYANAFASRLSEAALPRYGSGGTTRPAYPSLDVVA